MTISTGTSLNGFGIRQKITVILLASVMLSLVVTGSIYHFNSQQAIEKLAINHLKTVASVKRNYVIQTIKKNKERVTLISSRAHLRMNMGSFSQAVSEEEKQRARQNIIEVISDAKESISSIRKISIATIEGQIVASTSNQNLSSTIDKDLLPLNETKQKLNFRYDEDASKGALFLSDRLVLEGQSVGYILVEMDLSDFSVLTDNKHGLGPTEETTIAYRDSNGEVIPIYPESISSLSDDSSWVNPFALSRHNHDEITTYTDYRNMEVLAVAYVFESLHVGMVYKIDYEDALGIINEQIRFLVFCSLLTIIASIVVVLFVSRTITQPIVDLTYVATMIASGDLSKRIKNFSNDELGMLGMAFNQMADKLIEANHVLEDRVRTKTKELSEANENLAKLNRDLELLSLKDSLTNVANRRAFDSRLAIEWKRCSRDNTPLGVIMIDIDYFKRYNDSLGHGAGDECLQKVAHVLTYCFNRDSDLVARYGGEEFIVLLPNTPIEETRLLADKLQARILKANITHPDSPISSQVTFSIGVGSIVPNSSDSPDSYIDRVDAALYQSKKDGRNRATSI